jgi:hypothetical protein
MPAGRTSSCRALNPRPRRRARQAVSSARRILARSRAASRSASHPRLLPRCWPRLGLRFERPRCGRRSGTRTMGSRATDWAVVAGMVYHCFVSPIRSLTGYPPSIEPRSQRPARRAVPTWHIPTDESRSATDRPAVVIVGARTSLVRERRSTGGASAARRTGVRPMAAVRWPETTRRRCRAADQWWAARR